MTSRIETVRSYLQAGKSVCPHARACPLELVAVSAIPRADRAVIIPSVVAFGAARGNALVLVSEADASHAVTAAWATEAFLELMICCTWLDQPTIPIAEVESHVERNIRPTLDSPVIRPHLGLRSKMLMSICMSPTYPATHPRYAPHAIVVVTWSDDVSTAQGTSKIREAMVAEHGSLYDANELVLPLPTAAPRKLKMWIGNLDGSREGLVIASSKENARKIAGASRADFDDHWTEQRRIYPALDPEILYTRPMIGVAADGCPPRHPADAVPWYRGYCQLSKETKP